MREHAAESPVTPFWVCDFQQVLALLGQQAYRLCVGFHRLLHGLVALQQLQGADLILDKQTNNKVNLLAAPANALARLLVPSLFPGWLAGASDPPARSPL